MTEPLVRIRATRSFMDVREGDESVCPLDGWVQGLINAGHVVIVEQFPVDVTVKDTGPGEVTLVMEVGNGKAPAGPGGAEPDDAGGSEERG